MRKYLFGMTGGAMIFIACNTLPIFTPVFSCLAGELANGALEDPLLLITGCAGATLAALVQVIELEISNLAPEPDAGVVTVADAGDSSAAMAPPSPVPPNNPPTPSQVYKAHLQRILAKAQALQAQGVK
jgi:hypothetical protein